MKQFIRLFAVMGLVLALAPAAQAAPVTDPLDFDPVPTGFYRLMFVTDGTIIGTSGYISDYNSLAQTAGDAVLPGHTWTALAGTATVSARNNTGALLPVDGDYSASNSAGIDIPIYNLEGDLLTANNALLWAGTLATPATDQDGVPGVLDARIPTWGGFEKGGSIWWPGGSTGGGPLGDIDGGKVGCLWPYRLWLDEFIGADPAWQQNKYPVVAFSCPLIASPEIGIAGNGISIPDEDNTPSFADDTDFGMTSNNGTIVMTYTVTNSGSADLTLTDPATLTGTGTNQFTVGALTATNLTPGAAAATFTVTYTGSSTVAVHTATVSLGNNDSDENPYTFDITAETVLDISEIHITGLGNSITNGDITPSLADDTDFGSTTNNGTIVKTYTVTNTDFGILTLTDPATLTGTGAGQFAVGGLTSTAVTNGGAASTFTVTYTAGSTDVVYTATVNLVNNDGDNTPYTFVIKATGPVPEIDITGNGISITNGDNTPSLADGTDFDYATNTATIDKTYTVTNTGTADLILTDPATLTGTGTNQFTVGALTATTLSPGGAATFTVTYTASNALATHVATVSLGNNDTNNTPYTFDITADAVHSPPEIDITGNGISITNGDNTPSLADGTDFGSIPLNGSTILKIYTVSNAGITTLILTEPPTLTGTGAGQFTLGRLSATMLNPGQTAFFTVNYTPSSVPAVNDATVSLVNNDSDENPYTFDITAETVFAVAPADGYKGDYRLAFVTLATTNATSTDIADYNAFVSNAAANVSALNALGTTWKCLGSTASIDARVNTDTSPDRDVTNGDVPLAGYNAATDVPIYTTTGLRMADDDYDLWDGTIATPVYFEDGTKLTYNTHSAWVGSTEYGLGKSSRQLGAGTVQYSRGDTIDAGWMGGPGSAESSSSDNRRLMGLSGVIVGPGGDYGGTFIQTK